MNKEQLEELKKQLESTLKAITDKPETTEDILKDIRAELKKLNDKVYYGRLPYYPGIATSYPFNYHTTLTNGPHLNAASSGTLNLIDPIKLQAGG